MIHQILTSIVFWTVLVAGGFSVSRTPDGHPDMQGIWFFGSKTPHQRPLELGNKRYYTESEALALEQGALQQHEMRAIPLNHNHEAPQAGVEIGQEADGNFEATRFKLARINGEYRTSLIIDPPDGRLPYRKDAMDIFDRWQAAGFGEFDGPEFRPPSERCVNGIGQVPPIIGWRYNANLQIVQTPDHFVIAGETHPPRIIPFATEHRPHRQNQWMGDSIARWEGDALVIHTTGFNPSASFFELKSSGELQLRELFSLVSKDELFYRYTVTDPNIYTQPFTVEMSITRRPAGERIYEWACHEGNYSLPGILAGARRQESENQPIDEPAGPTRVNP
ncbi:MAG: hypothetical protein OES38_17250 [Gammaproteobacteria bacterium]|nr:hypothetical protein [Gammaproteobacteria bacterium]